MRIENALNIDRKSVDTFPAKIFLVICIMKSYSETTMTKISGKLWIVVFVNQTERMLTIEEVEDFVLNTRYYVDQSKNPIESFHF